MAIAAKRLAATHRLYDDWRDQWVLLGQAYEGDGGFKDGTNLVAHPREINYKQDADGNITSDIVSETVKFQRRKKIARYENFAQIIVDTLVAHQYAKSIGRSVGDAKAGSSRAHPIEAWWSDVDGLGSHMDDWLEVQQTLADTYGHVWIVMDLEPLARPARTRAEQARPLLRSYIPLDVWDWLAPRGRITAVKCVESLERASIFDVQPDLDHLEYRVWDARGWTVYDQDGKTMSAGRHAFGQAPVLVLKARRRSRIPVLGRSVLGDGQLFLDHYNLVSELRELLRSQTFSMFTVELGENEQITDARARLGPRASVDNLIFTRGGAGFVAPPDGPAAVYQSELEKLERKIYRLVGLPWEGDSRDAEAADSRRLKAMDLNRLLANHADEAERVDYAIAKLWFIANAGSREGGLAEFDRAKVTIKHPDEFHVEEVQQAVDDARARLSLRMGPTHDRIVRERMIPISLPDLDPAQAETITQEIAATPADPVAGMEGAANQFRNDLRANIEKAGGKLEEGAAA